jgi:hypothetical protein
MIKLLDGMHQSEVALLHEIHDIYAETTVFPGNKKHQAQIGLDQLTLCLLCLFALPSSMLLGALDELCQVPGLLG